MPLAHSLEEVVLANGARGLLIHVEGADIIHYKVHFPAGYNAVPDGVASQAAHVLEHVMYGYTSDKRYDSKAAYLDDFYKNGAYGNAATNISGSWLYGENVRDEWRRILALRMLGVTAPLLTEKTVKTEINNAADEIRSNVVNYERLSNELLYKLFNRNGQTSREKMDTIGSVTVNDIRDLYGRAYTTSNLRFIISGDITDLKGDIVSFFESLDLPTGDPSDRSGYDDEKGDSAYVRYPHMTNTFFNIGLIDRSALDEREYQALRMVNAYLFNSQNSKVLETARSRGICYRMQGSVSLQPTGTLWAITFPVSTENTDELLSLIEDGLRTVAIDGIEAEEVERIRDFERGRYIQGGQTVISLADGYAAPYFANGDVWRSDAMTLFDGVDGNLIRSVVRKMMKDGRQLTTGVGSMEEDDFTRHRTGLETFVNTMKEKI